MQQRISNRQGTEALKSNENFDSKFATKMKFQWRNVARKEKSFEKKGGAAPRLTTQGECSSSTYYL